MCTCLAASWISLSERCPSPVLLEHAACASTRSSSTALATCFAAEVSCSWHAGDSIVGATTRAHATNWDVANAHWVALWITLSCRAGSSHSAEIVFALQKKKNSNTKNHKQSQFSPPKQKNERKQIWVFWWSSLRKTSRSTPSPFEKSTSFRFHKKKKSKNSLFRYDFFASHLQRIKQWPTFERPHLIKTLPLLPLLRSS